jgi:hypothetical protein
VSDEGRECCCVAKPANICIKEGQEIKPFITDLNSQQTKIYWRTSGLQNEKCCAGFEPLPYVGKSNNGKCITIGATAVNISNWRTDRYFCNNCGDGKCNSPSETPCNCPADCK